MNLPSYEFAAALAATFHPQMEPESVAYMERHLMDALNKIGWEVRPKASDGQTSEKSE